MNRSVKIVIAAVALQAALVGLYWLVEHRRSVDRVPDAVLGTAPPVQVDGVLQGVTARSPDGATIDLQSVQRPTLLHLWATWCPPCRAELPGLLRVPDKWPVDVLAVALDRDWTDVKRFLSGHLPGSVLLGDASEIEAKLGVRSLPVTFLVEPGGRLRLRFDGARDWTDAGFVNTWLRGDHD